MGEAQLKEDHLISAPLVGARAEAGMEVLANTSYSYTRLGTFHLPGNMTISDVIEERHTSGQICGLSTVCKSL